MPGSRSPTSPWLAKPRSGCVLQPAPRITSACSSFSPKLSPHTISPCIQSSLSEIPSMTGFSKWTLSGTRLFQKVPEDDFNALTKQPQAVCKSREPEIQTILIPFFNAQNPIYQEHPAAGVQLRVHPGRTRLPDTHSQHTPPSTTCQVCAHRVVTPPRPPAHPCPLHRRAGPGRRGLGPTLDGEGLPTHLPSKCPAPPTSRAGGVVESQ